MSGGDGESQMSWSLLLPEWAHSPDRTPLRGPRSLVVAVAAEPLGRGKRLRVFNLVSDPFLLQRKNLLSNSARAGPKSAVNGRHEMSWISFFEGFIFFS